MENMVKIKELSFFKNKKIFITGHSGFKGSWLSYILDKNEIPIKVKPSNIEPAINPFGVRHSKIQSPRNLSLDPLCSPSPLASLAAAPQKPRNAFASWWPSLHHLLNHLK